MPPPFPEAELDLLHSITVNGEVIARFSHHELARRFVNDLAPFQGHISEREETLSRIIGKKTSYKIQIVSDCP